jgi:uncharacterized DUF497 family protein
MVNESNEKYSWDPVKRELNIRERKLDIVESADKIFAASDIVIKLDDRNDYQEKRYQAYATAEGVKMCLCFTPRGDKIHLITIFKVKEKVWRKHHG